MIRKGKRAAVFGCGPAGLFAAHALAQMGWDFDIFSRKRRSEIFGAQYLHRPIPGLPEISGELRYEFQGGTVEDYIRKVYGRLPPLGELRWAQSTLAEDPRPAWDIRAAYADAWVRYFPRIMEANLSAEWILNPKLGPAPVADLSQYSLFISSVPAPALCRYAGEPPETNPHQFHSQEVWAVGDAPERGVFCPVTVPDRTIVYNADKNTGWYRASNLFGYRTAEWPFDRKPPLGGALSSFAKPLRTNCDCWLDHPRFLRVGRYGAWDKTQHTHHAYLRTLEMIT